MKEECKNIGVRVPLSIVHQMERIAEKRKMTQSEVHRMCLEVGLMAHNDMEKVGLIGVVDMVYYVKQAIASKATGKQLVLPV